MIRIENICLKINNQLLLEDGNIELKEGSIHVIMGESGSGKTSLLYEISLLSQYSNANYYWNGELINRFDDNKQSIIRRNHIGYILQDLELISDQLTLRENIDCMYALVGEKYDAIKVNDYMDKLNLDCNLDQAVNIISRGERQRIAILLALVKDVELIVCDEPTSALDKKNIEDLMKYLRVITHEYKKIVVIATHDNFVAQHADTIYYISNKHLINKSIKKLITDEYQLKEEKNVDKRFYKILKKAYYNKLNLTYKIIYCIMMLMLCIGPLLLDSYQEKQNYLYKMYASNEIIVSNANGEYRNPTYDGRNKVLTPEQVNMLSEIKHVETVEPYWEMTGVLDTGQEFEEILIVPKQNINDITVSPTLSEKLSQVKIPTDILLENKEYTLEFNIEKLSVKDYPPRVNEKREIVYVPLDVMKEALKKQGVSKSSAVSVEVDNSKHIDSVISDIGKWLEGSTALSQATVYKDQIDRLEKAKEFIVVLKLVMIVGIVLIGYTIESMVNKDKQKEINILRINGVNENIFHKLHYYVDRIYIIGIICLCFISCLFIKMTTTISYVEIMAVIVQSITYILITKIVPILISIKTIFKKSISTILRD